MKRWIPIPALLVAITLPGGATQAPEVAATPELEAREMLDTYCVTCHNSAVGAGGLVLESTDLEALGREAPIWEAAVRKLRGRLMPPPGNPQPDQATVDRVVGWMEAALDANDERPGAGHVPIQRLTRSEYAMAVKDLVGVDVDPKEILPTEIEVEGFDNIAEALSVSPSFLAQYISAARHIAELAVGDPQPRLANAAYQAPGGDESYIDGFPLGTRGGMRMRHNFPADGDYVFNIQELDVGLYPRAVETRHTVVILIDGQEVFREQLGGSADLALYDHEGVAGAAKIMSRFQDIRVPVRAGVRDVVVTFIERSRAESESWTDGGGGLNRVPRLRKSIEIVGPYDPSGVSVTPSREKIFVCDPQPREEMACARRIAESLAQRAFRRVVDPADIDRLMPFFEAGLEEGGFDTGIEQVVAAVLASPSFLYRAIVPADGEADRSEFALDDFELASRLSFFIWSQGPDRELLDLARAGRLGDLEVLSGQVDRMLVDRRARSLVSGFALKWLSLDDLDAVEPDPEIFPEFDSALREDFAVELESFISSILMEDQNVLRLLDADYTFLNERLARHYGIESVVGPQFRRVTLQDPLRWGILGKGGTLLRTSYGNRTSPVLRGAWILEKLMGTPPAPPPPNVEAFPETVEGEKPKTVRSRLEQHRAHPICNQCHGVIDPYGLALENFDAIGRWRERDQLAEERIDASTILPSGTAISGPVELRNELLARPEMFAQAMTAKLMMYAVGRELEYFDMPQVRRVVDLARSDGYRWSAIVRGIATSEAFRMQALPDSSVSENPEEVASIN